MARAAAVLPAPRSPESVMTIAGPDQQGKIGHQLRGRRFVR